MNLIEIVCLIFIVQISSFFILVLGMKLGKEKEMQLNPIKQIKTEIKNEKVKKQEDKKIEQLNLILQNIDSYDGTNHNQKEVK